MAFAPRLLATGGVKAWDIAIDGRGVADCSLKGADDFGVPPVDHGSTKYSAVSAPVLIANVTQPESLAGSIEAYAPTARESCVACAPQDGRPGPAESLLHATVRTSPPTLVRTASSETRVFKATFELRRYGSRSTLIHQPRPELPSPCATGQIQTWRARTQAARLRARPRSSSGADTYPELQAPRPADRCPAEGGAFQQVFAIEYVVDVQLRANDRAAHGERIPDTRIHDDVRIHVRGLVEVEQARAIWPRRLGLDQPRSVNSGCRQVESTTRVHDARYAGQPLIVIEVEKSGCRIRRKESSRNRTRPERVVQGDVHVSRYRTRWTDLDNALDSRDTDLRDIDRCHDGRAWNRGIVDAWGALFPIRRQLRHNTEWKAMHVTELEEVVPLGQCRRGCHSSLGRARDGAKIFHVCGQEQPRVVDPERVGRVGKEAQLHTGADLVLVAGEGRVVIVEARAGPELPSIRWSDRA